MVEKLIIKFKGSVAGGQDGFGTRIRCGTGRYSTDFYFLRSKENLLVIGDRWEIIFKRRGLGQESKRKRGEGG